MKVHRFGKFGKLGGLALLAASACSGLGLVGGAASAQTYYDNSIVVMPYGHRNLGRGPSGAPIEEVSLSRVVSYADLNLRDPYDTREFQQRIAATARQACRDLDARGHGNLSVTTNAECVRDAINDAMIQADAAIYDARY